MDLTLTDFAFHVILVSFILVLVFAVASRTLHARVEKRSLGNRVICRLCLYAFEDASHVPAVHCPMCGALNEKGRCRRLG